MAQRKHSAFGLVASAALVASSVFVACGGLDSKKLNIVDGTSGDGGTGDVGGTANPHGGANSSGGRATGGSGGATSAEGGEGGEGGAPPEPDPGAPSVVSITPENGAKAVDPATPVVITFSEPLDTATVNDSTVIVQDSAGVAVAGTVTLANNVATFTPAAHWALIEPYKVTVKATVKDLDGIAMGRAFTAMFTVREGTFAPTDTQVEPVPVTAKVSDEPSLAGDGHGKALLVWAQLSGSLNEIYVRAFNGSKWDPPIANLDLATTDVHQPSVAMNEAGDAIVAWAQTLSGTDEAVYSRRYVKGAWDQAATRMDDPNIPAQTVVSISTFAAANGELFAAWTAKDPFSPVYNTGVRATDPTTGTWAQTPTLLGGSQEYSTPTLSADANGNAWLVQYPEGASGQIRVYRGSSGKWTSSFIAGSTADTLGQLSLVSDGAQGALAIWSSSVGANTQVVASTFDKVWSAPVPVSAPQKYGVYATSLARTPTGYVAAFAQGSPPVVYATQYTGSWSAAKALTEAATPEQALALATDPAGNAIVVFQKATLNNPSASARTWFSRLTHSENTWSEALQISNDSVDARLPQLVMFSDGTAVSVWTAATTVAGGPKQTTGAWANYFQ